MNVVKFDFKKVNKLKNKSVDELINNLTLEQIKRGNEKLNNDKGN
jgi:hypothetical protein